MKTIFVLLAICATLALQFHFGVRKKMYLGAALPLIFLALFAYMSYAGKTFVFVGVGAKCIGALIIIWMIGYVKSNKYERETLERMKIKDISFIHKD